MMKRTAYSQWIILSLAFFAFLMSAYLSRTVFERLPHLEDEIAYLYQARVFAGGQVVVPSPEPSNAFWQPFVVDAENGNRFGKYTPAWSAFLAIGVLLGQLWFINACFSMLSVALVYRIGHEIFNEDVGLFAALLMAFSPAALLLNGSLMGHTAALCLTNLFIYAYWRMEQHRRKVAWGLLAGVALGLLAAARPLTSIAIAAPFIVWSGARLLACFVLPDYAKTRLKQLRRVFVPLIALSLAALIFASTILIFNTIATGSPRINPYTLVWAYDKIGFGECCGRTGHTLEKAFRHANFDLSLTAADLFGWQVRPIDAEITQHLLEASDTYPATGYSFVLLPFGLLAGLFAFQEGQKTKYFASLLALWGGVAYFWWWMPQNLKTLLGDFGTVGEILRLPADNLTQPLFAYFWIAIALLLLLLPLVALVRWQTRTPQIPYTWLLLSLVLGIVLVQMLYWIGSQRYSTRYYYEALSAAALLSALALAWLAQGKRRYLVLIAVLGLSLVTLWHYSLPRIQILYRFNDISPEIIQQVETLREGDRPVLVIINGASAGDNRVRWRAYAALMAVTSPYFDSPIVVARDYGTAGMREAVLANFPNRQVLDFYGIGNFAYPLEQTTQD